MRRIILSFFLFVFFIISSQKVIALNFTPKERKIVIFRPEISQEERLSLLSRHQAAFSKNLKLINGAAITINRQQLKEITKETNVLRVDDDVEIFALPSDAWCKYAPWWPGCQQPTPNPTPTPSISPTPSPSLSPTPPSSPTPKPTATTTPTPTSTPTPTPLPSFQPIPWSIVRIKAQEAWNNSTGSGIKVAVLDSGIDRDHPDLKENLVGCVNFIYSWGTCEDDNGHGTHVSGIIAAKNNQIGVVGVAPNAKIYSLKVLNRKGQGYLSDLIEALEWVINNKIQIVNMSLGSTYDVVSFHEAIQRAYEAGIVQVASAGNSGPGADTVTYPAKYPEVIAVSATDSSDNIPSWSSRGSEIDITAPGQSVNSTYLGGGYKILSGTSMSAPHVTGTVALRLFLKPGETPTQIENILEANTDSLPISDPTIVGAGQVNAQKVVSAP